MDRPTEGSGEVSDERLLAEFLAGREAGFAALVERYSEEVYRFVALFVRNAAVAEDVVQETFVKVFQSAAGFDPSRRFRPWLLTIAANKARDHLRDRARKREVPIAAQAGGDDEGVDFLAFLADEPTSPTSRLEADEERIVVRGIIEKMPPRLREVLVLGYFHRLPYKDLAEALSIPLGTVKSRLHAAVANFAEEYKRAAGSRRAGAR